MKPRLVIVGIGLFFAVLVAAYCWPYLYVVNRVSTDQQVVALTFDDGPNLPYTDELLRILGGRDVKVTFFLIGSEIASQMEVPRRICRAGHEIGSHSYDWSMLSFKSRSSVLRQVEMTEETLSDAGINHISLFRAPKGILSPAAISVLNERNYVVVGGDVIAGDWKFHDTIQIKDTVLRKVRPGSIIVLHDGGGDRTKTLEAVPVIIDGLRDKGYSFLTVSELLNLTRQDASSTLECE
ncbi:MAG: polysaccharide deacetylase family protein [Verrucomicrobiota bacterium]